MLLSRLKVSALLLVPIVSGAATGGIMLATRDDKVSALETAHNETRARVEKLEVVTQGLTVDLAVVKSQTSTLIDGQKTMQEALDRMERHMGSKR